MIHTETLELTSKGNFESFNVTDRVREVIERSGITEGSALVFYRHTTGAVLIAEHEIGFLNDLREVFESIAPIGGEWKHHRRGYDANGGAHIRSVMISPSLSVPFTGGELLIGSYQEILVADFDPIGEERTRKLAVQVSGE
ncbi:MAG: secondary thiamine-phosphate synthase enzyme YjbQ [Spirochaetales bacterium]|nr:secondary thiamine-phosphate synthase enzyme YjbQ [Spirochaetales bacterium]MCF7939285.1 secondary thiamine-phosphate synthase enzyme YjbQ [Spirochaetales bacterium]